VLTRYAARYHYLGNSREALLVRDMAYYTAVVGVGVVPMPIRRLLDAGSSNPVPHKIDRTLRKAVIMNLLAWTLVLCTLMVTLLRAEEKKEAVPPSPLGEAPLQQLPPLPQPPPPPPPPPQPPGFGR
jgi:hypothetical protein